MKSQAPIKKLIIDSGPLIKHSKSLYPLSEEFFTVPEVLAEIKDQRTREDLGSLPYTIVTKSPSQDAINRIIQFSKLTGDYASLSLTDMKVLALTLQLEWETVGREHLLVTPLTFLLKEKQRKNDNVVKTQKIEKKVEQDIKELEKMNELNLGDSDGGEWITPKNFEKHRRKDIGAVSGDSSEIPKVVVGCVTSDFAMQNVLLQMRLHLMSVDGLIITQLKTWILRCHACFKTTTILDKMFCPSCGNATLLRTSITVKNGVMTVHLKKNFQYRNRGTVYAIPLPKNGKKAKNLILREDQKEYEKAANMKKRFEKKALATEMSLDTFLQSKTGNGADFNELGPIFGYGRKNPNESRTRRRK